MKLKNILPLFGKIFFLYFPLLNSSLLAVVYPPDVSAEERGWYSRYPEEKPELFEPVVKIQEKSGKIFTGVLVAADIVMTVAPPLGDEKNPAKFSCHIPQRETIPVKEILRYPIGGSPIVLLRLLNPIPSGAMQNLTPGPLSEIAKKIEQREYRHLQENTPLNLRFSSAGYGRCKVLGEEMSEDASSGADRGGLCAFNLPSFPSLGEKGGRFYLGSSLGYDERLRVTRPGGAAEGDLGGPLWMTDTTESLPLSRMVAIACETDGGVTQWASFDKEMPWIQEVCTGKKEKKEEQELKEFSGLGGETSDLESTPLIPER